MIYKIKEHKNSISIIKSILKITVTNSCLDCIKRKYSLFLSFENYSFKKFIIIDQSLFLKRN